MRKNQQRGAVSLIELLLALAIAILILLVAIPGINEFQSRKQLLRKVRAEHSEAVLVVKVTRNDASHYVVTVKNNDGSMSTHTLPKK